MPDPRTYHFVLPPSARPVSASLAEQWYPGIQAVLPSVSSSRIYDPILGIRAVVIHATAGSSSAGAASVIFARAASFHWLVPDEDEPQHGEFVWATCHEARAAWHVRNSVSHPEIWGGRNRINHYSLGIEVVNALNSSDTFSDWQVEATADIVRYCWAKYPNLTDIVSHAKLEEQNWPRRTDPGSLFPWEDFKRLVLQPREDMRPIMARTPPESIVMPVAVACCMDAQEHRALTV